MSTPDDALSAALEQLAEHAAILSRIDLREADHWVHIRSRLRELAVEVSALADTGATAGELLERLDLTVAELSEQVARFADLMDSDDGPAGAGYHPIPAPRWWLLAGAEREDALERLTRWVEDIYRPSYGHLAVLGSCWAQHPLCLFTLDWLSELWQVMYLQPKRTTQMLGGEAEWQTRLLPAAAEQMSAETRSCAHRQSLNGSKAAAR